MYIWIHVKYCTSILISNHVLKHKTLFYVIFISY